MEDKGWDDQFRDLLGDHTPAEEHPFAQTNHDLKPDTQLPDHNPLSPEDSDLQAKGWKRIEASLNAADQAFDEHIRQRLHQHYPKYDPNSWPVFLKRFTDSRFLRAKLIVLKSIEVVALLLLLLTAVNMGRLGKLPFTGNLFEPNVNSSKQDQQVKPEATTPFIKAPSPKAETRKDQ
ncbi:MAG TPA: hypothetical protein VJ508_00895, partial [Saprospiraceae bacterium]|nr:hypothetical protein [Saprospiraceae bacterium]